MCEWKLNVRARVCLRCLVLVCICIIVSVTMGENDAGGDSRRPATTADRIEIELAADQLHDCDYPARVLARDSKTVGARREGAKPELDDPFLGEHPPDAPREQRAAVSGRRHPGSAGRSGERGHRPT